jgi:hypothetical protein
VDGVGVADVADDPRMVGDGEGAASTVDPIWMRRLEQPRRFRPPEDGPLMVWMPRLRHQDQPRRPRPRVSATVESVEVVADGRGECR